MRPCDQISGIFALGVRAIRPCIFGLWSWHDIEDKVRGAIEAEIGKIARPTNVWIAPDMPKARSGKIMRTVIAAVSNFTDIGDTTRLGQP